MIGSQSPIAFGILILYITLLYSHIVGHLNATFTSIMAGYSSTFPIYLPETAEFAAASILISAEIKIKFRNCHRGEIFSFQAGKSATCLTCENGYSFADNSDNSVLECQKCPAKASYCHADQIYLNPGTWRWSTYATTIFDCPMESGCVGGNQTGQPSCAAGYTG